MKELIGYFFLFINCQQEIIKKKTGYPWLAGSNTKKRTGALCCILRRFCIELLLAARGAEEVLLSLEIAGEFCSLLIHRHAADRIDCHVRPSLNNPYLCAVVIYYFGIGPGKRLVCRPGHPPENSRTGPGSYCFYSREQTRPDACLTGKSIRKRLNPAYTSSTTKMAPDRYAPGDSGTTIRQDLFHLSVRSFALIETITVLALIRTAPIAGVRRIP